MPATPPQDIVANRPALQLARRIDEGLRQLLGEGIDLSRVVSDALYRRDVLLVCDACAPGALATLAQELRTALSATAPAANLAPVKTQVPEPPPTGPDSAGFSPSRFFNSLFGAWQNHADGDSSQRHQARARQRGGWFGR